MLARLWHGAIAVLVLAALAIQIVIAVHAAAAPPAHAVGTLAGTPLTGRLVRVLSFFTIQSNVLAALSSAHLARHPDRDNAFWRVVRLDALIGIAVTGIVYSSVLARIHEPKGWEQVSTNTVFHYVTPVMMVLGWLAFGPRPGIDAQILRWSLAWPILWFGYTIAHGAATRWYPYPFTDVATQGFARVLVNALLVTLVLTVIAALLWLGERTLPRSPG